jgi:anthranilate phosphoribosyltransferase
MADVFARRGASALVFRGDDGLDELTTTTTSQVHVVRAGAVHQEVLDPARLGIVPATLEDLRGGLAPYNAQVVRELLAGKTGSVRDAVVLNAAGALVALADAPGSLEDQVADGLVRAAEAIDSGAAAAALDRWVETTQSFTTS